MPDKTFAHAGAIRLTLERLSDEGAVIGQGSNERMLRQEGERFLLRCLAPHELPQRANAPATMREGNFTGFFQQVTRMLFRQR